MEHLQEFVPLIRWKKLTIKNHLGHTWYGFKTYKPFHWSFLQVLGLVALVSFDLIKWKLCFIGMNVVMGWKTIAKTLTTWGQSSMVFWPTFPSKGFTHGQMWWKSLFTIRLILGPMEIYAHSACEFGSTSQMSKYAPHVFHKLKEFIWTQLGLRYTMKQIYDKHKEIWWPWVNEGEWMTQNDFLQLQDIAYLDRKHKKALGACTQTLCFPFSHGFTFILMMIFISRMQVR